MRAIVIVIPPHQEPFLVTIGNGNVAAPEAQDLAGLTIVLSQDLAATITRFKQAMQQTAQLPVLLVGTEVAPIPEKTATLVQLTADHALRPRPIQESRQLLLKKPGNQLIHFPHPMLESHFEPEFGVVHIQVIGYSKTPLEAQ